MKGFLVAVALLGGIVFLLKESAPSDPNAGYYATATGVAVDITPENYGYEVTHNEAPVLAYFWAGW